MIGRGGSRDPGTDGPGTRGNIVSGRALTAEQGIFAGDPYITRGYWTTASVTCPPSSDQDINKLLSKNYRRI